MIEVFSWWLLLELIGLAVLPIALRFFRNLPDRGYAFIKPLGLLLIAYPFWLLTTFGFLTNTRGAIALVAILVALASWFADRYLPLTTYQSPLTWLRDNRALVLATELVFTIAFIAWAIVRAYMPDITATEKPMEFAFLNGVLQSETFPPRDPWLAGYAISYYYFGYIIVGMLTMLSGVAPSIAFNLAIALMLALAATGAYGLAYNLIRDWGLAIRDSRPISNLQSLIFPIFAPIFLVLIGNLEGFFESLHAAGLGSREFWDWLDVKQLADAPVTHRLAPQDNWWWWRASRVIHDVALGQTQEVIDEFPQFSFLLGDMHPHVLALPFVLLALALALNLLNSKFLIRNSEFNPTNHELRITNYELILLPLVLGGLFTLNSWDILPYGFILIVAFAIARYRASDGWDARATRDLIAFVIALGVASVIMYLPFYIGFQSQAGGILPVLFVKTKLHHYFLMFGLFVFILGAFIAHRLVTQNQMLINAGASIAQFIAFLVAIPLALALIAFTVFAISPAVRASASAAITDEFALLAAFFGPLRNDPWLFILLAMLLTAIFVLLRAHIARGDDSPESFAPRAFDASAVFVLLLAFVGLFLTFGSEFAYIRDQFGTRMNTIFKFYFQAWTLFAIASACAVFYLSRLLTGIARGAWFVALALLLGASIVYPALAIPNRAEDFRNAPTLDGLAWIRQINPGDYAAIQWLTANAPRGAHILEAPGNEYSYGNRVSMATGLATPLGWAGHESQWRGGSAFFKNDAAGIDRAADIARIYQTLNPAETLTYLDKYAIKFVVVGGEERAKYSLTKPQIDKFGKILQLVFEDGDVRIYAR
jgi:YYY domain-containing protein